jgi:hypothetical protein
MNMRLELCSREAARKACRRWHYSRKMPAGEAVFIGVWEDGRFIGAVIFSHGANRHIADPFGLSQEQVCELTRIAMDTHQVPVTRVVAIALRFLKKLCPGLRVVISYADSEQGHLGKIYQAGNWIYTGESIQSGVRLNGERLHKKTVSGRYGTCDIEVLRKTVDPEARWESYDPKFRYVYPLDPWIRGQLEGERRPYPKQLAAEASRDVPPYPGGEGGSTPTPPLLKGKG